MKAVREEEVELWGIGFGKQIGSESEREIKRAMDEQSGETKE